MLNHVPVVEEARWVLLDDLVEERMGDVDGVLG